MDPEGVLVNPGSVTPDFTQLPPHCYLSDTHSKLSLLPSSRECTPRYSHLSLQVSTYSLRFMVECYVLHWCGV